MVDLVTFANGHMKDPAKLSVSRNDHVVEVMLAAGELAAMVHPSP